MLKTLRGASARKRKITHTITANVNNQNVFTLFGSPTLPVTYELTINSGVIIGSTSTSVAALVTGVFPAGSTLIIINNGKIYGKGGAGGAGKAPGAGTGNAGGVGGTGLQLEYDLTLDNNDTISGGGGGGGSGGGTISGETIKGGGCDYDCGNPTGGHGGGGGASYGAGGSGTGTTCDSGYSGGLTTGGAGRTQSDCSASGAGGALDTAGSAGSIGLDTAFSCSCSSRGAGGAGGAAGTQIDNNGYTRTDI